MHKILSIKPKEFLKQGISHCGCYCVKAVLQAYGKDDTNKPEELHLNIFGKITGSSLGKNYYTKILGKYGLKAETKCAEKLSDKEKIEILKQLLLKDKPVMMRIGNGYGFSGKYSWFMARFIMHWITLWGFDDEKKLFYVYDSGLPKKYWDNALPTGNTTRTYEAILRDWRIRSYNPLYFPFMGRANHLYIEIK